MPAFLLEVCSQVLHSGGYHWKKQRYVPELSVKVRLSPKSDDSCMWLQKDTLFYPNK